MVSAPASNATGTLPLLATLRSIAGPRHILTSTGATRRYTRGYRSGGGAVLAVVRPGSLVELWRVINACVAADVIVIMQAANTGLTGGSTPDGDAGYDRDIVLVNTLRLNRVTAIRDGRQVLCFPGATLDGLQKMLAPMGREPHSVIGSSCLGASVVGGVCNSSGGALVNRGPAYTELALYARMHADGRLELVNRLGVALGDDAEEILARLDRGAFSEADIQDGIGIASDHEYAAHVRAVDESTPARFNADPRRLFEASGSAGRLILFAVRMDTFAAQPERQLFYIGTNDAAALTSLRRDILTRMEHLPVSAEYMHRDAYDIAARYGKDLFLIIEALGTKSLPALFTVKGRMDALADGLCDRIMQVLSGFLPRHLPRRINEYRGRFEHYLLIDAAADGIGEMRRILAAASGIEFFECTADERRKAMLHRFVAAGAAVRYRAVHARDVADILALDIALRRNDTQWREELPPDITRGIVASLYYGHFLCHVFHQDYIIRKGHDPAAIKDRMLALLDARGAQYPAEHNVGHAYKAAPVLRDFYRALDPRNAFNPGIGKTSKKRDWA
jgi:D-lactate dehydrogenase